MSTTAENPTNASTEALTKKDFVTPNDVRWCPGCGDYAILNALQRTFPELGVARENFVVISGIGCSSRFPYYMNTYGFHTIHGRAPAVAAGVKIANPDLSVWIVTGDGDGLSIGGNHLMHLLRRNLDVTVLLFNNRVYGLTKGQYSPTSPVGARTKTTPMGSIDNPINPLRFALSAEATFVARTYDTNVKHMTEVFKAAHNHKGVAFIEILQNCVIFNDGAFEDVVGRGVRDEELLFVEAGLPLLFGKEMNKGIRIRSSLTPEVVTIGENGVTVDDIIVHEPANPELLYPSMLAQMKHPNYPTVMGVIRNLEQPTYDDGVHAQIDMARASRNNRPETLGELLRGENYWTVE